MDCSFPGSSVHGVLQVGILEWIAIPISRSSQPRDRTHIACIAGVCFPTEPPGKPCLHYSLLSVQSNYVYKKQCAQLN